MGEIGCEEGEVLAVTYKKLPEGGNRNTMLPIKETAPARGERLAKSKVKGGENNKQRRETVK